MPSYNMVSEFSAGDRHDYVSRSPYWVVAVVRWAQPLTFSRAKLFAHESSVGFDSDPGSLVAERAMLVITDDVIGMSVHHDKSSFMPLLNITFAGGDLNYLSEIQPNDWILAWIVNDETQGQALRERVIKMEACNKFDDGLKFVGRVQSIREHLQQSPEGVRQVRYQLQAAGNKELSGSVFFDPALLRSIPTLQQFMLELGVNLKEILDPQQIKGGISGIDAISKLFGVLLGTGIPPQMANTMGIRTATGLDGTDAPYAYVVPKTVLRLLGRVAAAKPVPCAADLLELNLGLQKYSGGNTPEAIFAPVGAAGATTSHRILNRNLLTTFMPMPIAFSNKTVWSLLSEFVNPTVNELYTALRVSAEGDVVPTVILRQLPFSTPYAMTHAENANKLTGFLELPRWVADPIQVSALDLGKSDSLRVNFVHVYGSASPGSGANDSIQLMQHHPVRDEQDIKRGGLCPYMATVSSSIESAIWEPKAWMELVADFVVGQQYTLTGSVAMFGVTAPICPGDNFEFDNTVSHIESVDHQCGIQGDRKFFTTSLSLTHGIRSDTEQKTPGNVTRRTTVQVGEYGTLLSGDGAWAQNPEFNMYAGTLPSDNLGYVPSQTVDSRHHPTTVEPMRPQPIDKLGSREDR